MNSHIGGGEGAGVLPYKDSTCMCRAKAPIFRPWPLLRTTFSTWAAPKDPLFKNYNSLLHFSDLGRSKRLLFKKYPFLLFLAPKYPVFPVSGRSKSPPFSVRGRSLSPHFKTLCGTSWNSLAAWIFNCFFNTEFVKIECWCENYFHKYLRAL